MDLDKQVVNEVKDLFDIKYDSNEGPASTEGMSKNFADLEDEVSSVISNMDDKGKVLDIPIEEVVEEPVEENKENVEVEETELETIDDLIANSVEEAKALTTAQDVQAEEEKKVEEEQLIDDFDSIEVHQVDVKDEVIVEENLDALQTELELITSNAGTSSLPSATEEELADVQRQLSQVAKNPGLDMSHNSHAFLEEVVEISPVVLEEENIEIIPQKDSEGNIKGELRMRDVKDVFYDNKGKPHVSGGEIVWSADSPSEFYEEFYEIKREHIQKFSGGQQLNFIKLYQDLYNAKVDTSTEVLDQGILTRKMDEVMHCIERVAMIQVQINQQHFVWKRFVELLRGVLARVQYLKPVLKQDGLILEHMGDVEFYANRLQAIKDSAHDVMGTLEKAFESLSRKVTIMLTVQSKHTIRMSPDAYSQSNQQSYQSPPEPMIEEVPIVEEVVVPQNTAPVKQMDEYDGFEIGAEVKTGKPKPGSCDWGDVW